MSSDTVQHWILMEVSLTGLEFFRWPSKIVIEFQAIFFLVISSVLVLQMWSTIPAIISFGSGDETQFLLLLKEPLHKMNFFLSYHWKIFYGIEKMFHTNKHLLNSDTKIKSSKLISKHKENYCDLDLLLLLILVHLRPTFKV